jgi:cytochrome c-type biogenesis protein CcmF
VGLIVWRREQLRTEAHLSSLLSREAVFLFQNLVLVAMVAVIFWITFFPLISQAITGTKVSVGPPAFRPFIVPLALLLVLLSGIGPIIAWRRVTVANLRRNFTFPVIVAVAVLVALLAADTGVSAKPFALCMFVIASFAVAGVAQELWRGTSARRAAGRMAYPVAFASLIRRNRRRYGGYIVHLGLAVLLVGVAASSSFQHSSDVALAPGQHVKVNGYTFRYVRPTAAVSDQKISFGAVLDVSKGTRHVTTLSTTRGFYPAPDESLGVIGRFFGGEADSNVGLKTGLTRDIWTIVNPDLTPLQAVINQGNKVFGAAFTQAMSNVAARGISRAQAQQEIQPLLSARNAAVEEIAARYVTHPWPVDFLLIVSPLVMWIWLGAAIIALGGLLALWPVPKLAGLRAALRGSGRARRTPLPDPAPHAPAPHAPTPPAPAPQLPVREPV